MDRSRAARARIAPGESRDKASLGVWKRFDRWPHTVGNGALAALMVDSNERVDRVQRKTLELGGTDEFPASPLVGRARPLAKAAFPQ